MRVRISNRLSRALAAGSLLASLASVAQADDDQGPKEKEPVSAEEAAEKGNLDVTVLFKFDSSALDPAAKASLVELAVWA